MMELNMMNSFLAGAMSKVWEFMSSGIAIAIYAGVLGFVLIMLIIALMGRDSSKASQVVINSTQGTVLQAGGPLVATGGVKAAGKTDAKNDAEGEGEEIQEGKGRFCKL